MSEIDVYIIAAMAALGIGGGFAGLAWGWRESLREARLRRYSMPGALAFAIDGARMALGDFYRVILYSNEDANTNTYGYIRFR